MPLKSERVITKVDNEPADSNVTIFHQFISFEGFTASLDTLTHIAMDTKTNIKIISLPIFDTPHIFLYLRYIRFRIINDSFIRLTFFNT